ncbi:YcaQ family DNA glycosylase [bacterium]|nr:YcaQ family DNA glycosylase [bacterium]
MPPASLDVSLPAARLVLLHQQGLLTPPRRAARKADVLACIRRMGLLQIDTIHIVARSPYLVLFSRLGNYEPRWLDQTHSEGRLFEFFSHAMCWLPIEDFPLWRWRALRLPDENATLNWKRNFIWLAKNQSLVEHIIQRIRDEGPLRSADFEPEQRKSGTWWAWKDEKLALELLMYTGRLMIPRRERFQRVYDLSERVLPDWDDSQALDPEEASLELTRRAALALGPATEPWIRDYHRQRQDRTRRALDRLLADGLLLEARIEGLRERAYLSPEMLPLLKKAEAGKLEATHSTLLSPFDPLVWHRLRASQLFGFDYLIECYTPEHKRVYGYFTLPILLRGRLIGRVDAKAHRGEGVFELRALHLEPGLRLSAAELEELARTVQRCADWHRCPQVRVLKTEPPALAARLRSALKSAAAAAES